MVHSSRSVTPFLSPFPFLSVGYLCEHNNCSTFHWVYVNRQVTHSSHVLIWFAISVTDPQEKKETAVHGAVCMYSHLYPYFPLKFELIALKFYKLISSSID